MFSSKPALLIKPEVFLHLSEQNSFMFLLLGQKLLMSLLMWAYLYTTYVYELSKVEVFIFLVFCLVLDIKPRVLQLVAKCSTTELHNQVLVSKFKIKN